MSPRDADPGISGLGESALAYAARGWAIFPLSPGTKLPTKGSHGHLDATTDRDQIRRWWTDYPDANIGLNLAASGLVVIDCDTYKVDCGWVNFITGRDLPDTLVQRSSRGGTHFFFTCAFGEVFAGALCRDVEIKHAGYVLLEPSRFQGKQYVFETDDDPAPAPDWIPRQTKTEAPNGELGADFFRIAEALGRIPNSDLPWHDWNRVALALWRATAGSAAGLGAFHEWSSRSGKYDPAATERRWAGICKSPPTRIGAGTLFYLANEALFANWPGEGGGGDGGADDDAGLPPYLGRTDEATHAEATAKVAERLNDHGLAFQFGGAATLISREASGALKDREGKPHVAVRAVRATAQALVLKIEVVSSWSAWDGRKKALVPKPVPMWLPQTLIELRGEGLAPLAGVAYHPLIWQGQLLAEKLGYHRPTLLYLDAELIEPELFTDAKEALAFLLDDWLKPFPFKTPDDGRRALLLPLTLLLRRTGVMGGAPLLFVTSPELNTGKTYLVLCLCAAVLGAEPGVMTFSEDEEELRKALMAALLESPPVIVFDNLRNGAAVRHVALDRYATSEIYSDRRLGATETVTVPTTSTLVFTGNNIVPVGDLASRVLEIRLERRPGGNGGLEEVLARTKLLRPKILGALLAISQTAFEGKHTSRFPSWERVVARPLMSVAESATLLDALNEQDTGLEENVRLGDLLDAMAKIQKAKGEREDAPEVVVWLSATEVADGCTNELKALTGRKAEDEKITANRVPYELRPWRDRQGSSYRLRMLQEKTDKGKRFWRYRAEEEPM